MSSRLPPSARRVLDEGVLLHLAVATPKGPHLTPVVYVLDGGRLWVTTSRSSVKARAWRRDPAVAGLVQAGETAVIFRGRVRTYDVLEPTSWPAAAVAGPRLVSAATRFSVKNARFFAGYAVDARRLPFAWSPPGRLFAGLELQAGRVLDVGTGAVLDRWGEWPAGVRYENASTSLDRAAAREAKVPSHVWSAVGQAGTAALALQARSTVAVVPVAWRRADGGVYEATAPAAVARLSRIYRSGQAALTLTHASRWRAADMTGMVVQGSAHLYSPRSRSGGIIVRRRLEEGWDGALPDNPVLLRLRPDRVVWWKGWTSGTVPAS
jgi:Pyridoxamine 5'-phosphate oxidase